MIYRPENQISRLLTTRDVCELLQIHPNTLRRYYQTEGLHHIRLKRGIRFYPETLQAFLERRELPEQA